MRSIIGFYLVIEAITLMSWVFSYVFVMTGGGPGQATQVTETYIYQNAFASDIPWLAAAAATLLLIGVTAIAAAFLVARCGLLAAEGGMIVERAGRLVRQLVLIIVHALGAPARVRDALGLAANAERLPEPSPRSADLAAPERATTRR